LFDQQHVYLSGLTLTGWLAGWLIVAFGI